MKSRHRRDSHCTGMLRQKSAPEDKAAMCLALSCCLELCALYQQARPLLAPSGQADGELPNVAHKLLEVARAIAHMHLLLCDALHVPAVTTDSRNAKACFSPEKASDVQAVYCLTD